MMLIMVKDICLCAILFGFFLNKMTSLIGGGDGTQFTDNDKIIALFRFKKKRLSDLKARKNHDFFSFEK